MEPSCVYYKEISSNKTVFDANNQCLVSVDMNLWSGVNIGYKSTTL